MAHILNSDHELNGLFERTKTIAVVGASDNPARAAYGVGAYLLTVPGWTVWFVNPNAETVLGHTAYASLKDLPAAPDVVDVFRKAEDLDPVLDDAIAVGARAVWLQLGISRDDIAARAVDAGLDIVMDRCIYVDHARLNPAS